MQATIRAAAGDDVAALAALHVATWKEAYADLLPDAFFTQEFSDGRVRMWNQILIEQPREDSRIVVAERAGELVGFAMVGRSFGAEGQDLPRDRQLYMIYVLASEYGSGLGQRLLDAALGDEAAMLWVAKENPRAVAFYHRNGFEFDGAEQTDPGAPLITDARMIR